MSKKDTVMNSAIKLFLDKGFANVSNSDIIRDSGVGSGTIYYHFEDKDDLILSVLNKYIMEMLVERLNIVKSFEGNSYDTLSFMFKQMIGCDREVEPYIVPIEGEEYSFQKLVLLACEGIQKYEKVCDKYNEFNDAFAGYIDEYVEKGKANNEIREDISTEELSYFIQANINGIFFMQMIQDNLDVEEIIGFNFNNTWNYIKK